MKCEDMTRIAVDMQNIIFQIMLNTHTHTHTHVFRMWCPLYLSLSDEQPRKTSLEDIKHEKPLTVPEARATLNARINGKHAYKAAPLLRTSVYGSSFFRHQCAHGSLRSRTSVSGHIGQTGASLDVGVTLMGSLDENIGLMSGMTVRAFADRARPCCHR
jgi:hypothetical protein